MPAVAVAAPKVQCECVVSAVPAGTAVGSIVEVETKGNVSISKVTGYEPAVAGDTLLSGARLMVGPGSWASVQFGSSCQFTVPENQTLRIDLVEGGNCAWYKDPNQAVAPPSGNATTIIVGATGIAAIVGGALLLSTGDDDPVSD